VIAADECPSARCTVTTSQPARDQPGGVKVPQIVQPVPDTGGAAGGPPGPRDGGRVGGLVAIAPSGEQPTVRVLAVGPVLDMPGQHRHQQRQAMCRPLQVHQTALTDQPGSL
jgi:hypothetical protein